jgi:hypothetical protein
MNQKPLVITHGNCYDGFTAAWVFRHFKGDAEFVHTTYGEKPPDTKGRVVYVLDFSFPREVMMKDVILPSISTTIFDHHKTAQADLDKILQEVRIKFFVQRQNDRVVFDMNRSGAGITFDELETEDANKKGRRIPRINGLRPLWLVDYIEDRDLWKFALPESKEVSAYISTQPHTFESWDAINALGQFECVTRGRSVLAYIDQFGEKACAEAHIEGVGGYKIPVINTPYMNCSDHVNKLLMKNPDAAFAAGYFQRKDGRWQFSLRSEGEFDVSEIAKLYGGGGHKHAAGFDVAELPWKDAAEKQVAPTVAAEVGIPVEELEASGTVPVVATQDGDDAVVKLGEDSI